MYKKHLFKVGWRRRTRGRRSKIYRVKKQINPTTTLFF